MIEHAAFIWRMKAKRCWEESIIRFETFVFIYQILFERGLSFTLGFELFDSAIPCCRCFSVERATAFFLFICAAVSRCTVYDLFWSPLTLFIFPFSYVLFCIGGRSWYCRSDAFRQIISHESTQCESRRFCSRCRSGCMHKRHLDLG